MKVGDSLILDEDGNFQPIIPDTFYERNIIGYWALKRLENSWKIIKVLLEPYEKQFRH